MCRTDKDFRDAAEQTKQLAHGLEQVVALRPTFDLMQAFAAVLFQKSVNSLNAILILCDAGFGIHAVPIARQIVERATRVKYFIKHLEDLEGYLREDVANVLGVASGLKAGGIPFLGPEEDRLYVEVRSKYRASQKQGKWEPVSIEQMFKRVDWSTVYRVVYAVSSWYVHESPVIVTRTLREAGEGQYSIVLDDPVAADAALLIGSIWLLPLCQDVCMLLSIELPEALPELARVLEGLTRRNPTATW